jgi:acetyltransferase
LIAVRVLDPDEAARRQDQLIQLLVDAVEGGASIGFVLPLSRAEAAAYWQGVTSGLRESRLALVAAVERDRLVGSVQLGLEPRANGRHRAEVMKLMVRRAHRRRGIGRSLLQELCDLAHHSGRTLLLLDVRTGDPAEALYRSCGFVRFGEVPGYAREPHGRGLAASSFYYLQLPSAPSPGRPG